MQRHFDLQGHRGARGLKPENTLPSFEAALDLMVSSLETDLHLTRNGVPVLCHDQALSEKLVRIERAGSIPDPRQRPLVSSLTLEQLRHYSADRNPDPQRFSTQNNQPTPAAEAFTRQRGTLVYGLPTVEELFDFVAEYAGDLGRRLGKSDAQRTRARQVRFALELKRVPFRPQFIADGFDGDTAGPLEQKVAELIKKKDLAERTTVQCFDHRAVKAIRKLEPKITGAALIANTAPASVPRLAADADAQVYSPDFAFLDARQIKQAHAGSIRVVPYTINDPEDMKRLLDWSVDGIITDYPDRLIPLLQSRHLSY